MPLSAAGMLMGLSFAPLAASVSPSSASGSDSGSPVSSNNVTASTTGGSGQRSFSWARISGSSSIQANSPNSATTNFSASLDAGENVSATFRCTITDLVTGEVRTVDVTVFLSRNYPSLSASGSGNPNGSVNSYSVAAVYSGTMTVTPSGGAPPYSYAWFKESVDPVSINPSGNQAYAAVSVGPQQGYYYACRCRVTDSIGQFVDVYFNGLLQNTSPEPPPMGASADTGSVYGFDTQPSVTTGVVNISASGVAPFSYNWTRLSGVGSASGGSSCSFTHNFGSAGSASGTFRCRVVDNLGRFADVVVTAEFTYFPGGGGIEN